jgi:hypothetical protein
MRYVAEQPFKDSDWYISVHEGTRMLYWLTNGMVPSRVRNRLARRKYNRCKDESALFSTKEAAIAVRDELRKGHANPPPQKPTRRTPLPPRAPGPVPPARAERGG